jgi:hypothetical protein
MLDTIWAQLRSLFDLENPFSIYFWVMAVSLLIRGYFVLLPLRRIYLRYTIKISEIKIFRIRLRNIFQNLRVFKKETSVSGIEAFLIQESILAVAPMIAAATIRLLLGTPSVAEWDTASMVGLMIVFSVWLLFNIKRSLDMRTALAPLERLYSHPIIMNSGINSAIWSRRKLVQLSQIEIPEYIEMPETDFSPMVPKAEADGKRRLDSGAILDNVKQVGGVVKVAVQNLGVKAKESTKEYSARATEKLDQKVQQQVDGIIGFSSSRLISFIGHLVLVLGPVFAIYILN